MTEQVKIGTYEGTGAAINIELGWVPDHVRVINGEDGDAAWEWFNGFGAGDALQAINVVDSGTSGAAGLSLITSNGIDAYQGSSSVGKGFTVGTALSESGKTFRYVAMRNAV